MWFNSINDYELWKEAQETFNNRVGDLLVSNSITITPMKSFVAGMNNPYQAQSTFIGPTTFQDDVADVRVGNRNYLYPMTEDEFIDWFSSNSLGKYFNENVKRG